MLFSTRFFVIVSLLFVTVISALPASTIVDREAGSVRDWKRQPEELAADILSGLKREAGSVRDWKREAGSVRDWKREAGSVRDWKREAENVD
ncbi:hypothetical protein C0995_014151 [Termitomyces sp. Mi166|nr:hypothetical protein C0995_014151 [Termitomyces sp. Mi166\